MGMPLTPVDTPLFIGLYDCLELPETAHLSLSSSAVPFPGTDLRVNIDLSKLHDALRTFLFLQYNGQASLVLCRLAAAERWHKLGRADPSEILATAHVPQGFASTVDMEVPGFLAEEGFEVALQILG